jgi:hypothetical protein
MYVLAGELSPETLQVVTSAAASAGLEARSSATVPADLTPDLLAVVHSDREAQPEPSATATTAHGAYAILVLDRLSPTAVLDAATSGYAFTLTPYKLETRLAHLLGYLCTVAAPEPTRTLSLSASHLLSSASASVRLEPGEAELLTQLGESTGRVVPWDELAQEATGRPGVLKLVADLTGKLEQIGSGARILKVPHLGFRLSGRLHPVEANHV